MEETRLVRLKPYDPEEGNLRQRYAVNLGGVDSALFKAGNWYKVSKKMADYLATVRQSRRKSSPKAFDICLHQADAEELLRREREEKERGKRPEDAITMARDLTTADMPKPTPIRPSSRPQAPAEPEGEPEPPPDEHEPTEPPPRPKKKAKAKAKKKAAPKRKAKAKK